MRTTQFIGLRDQAISLLQKLDNCPTCGQDVPGSNLSTIESPYTWLDIGCEEHRLPVYVLKSGVIAYEDVQAAPWSSGPVIFTALRDVRRKWIEESKWTDEEMEALL